MYLVEANTVTYLVIF